jgi:hypothetical protein
MNDEVRFPIETIREGNKITKTCVEDVHKIVNRVQDCMNKAHNNSVDILDSLEREGYGERNAIVFGTGVSQPCLTDAFDEEIGNNIAFMKMKLNANIKKHNFLVRVYNEYYDLLCKVNEELSKIDSNIYMDLEGVRRHNPSYLEGIETKLGIY